jgi:hypothetical protein
LFTGPLNLTLREALIAEIVIGPAHSAAALRVGDQEAMNSRIDLFSSLGSAIVIALLVAGVLWQRQAKQRFSLGFGRVAIVYLIALAACVSCIVGLMTLSRATGLKNGKWLMQLMWMISGVIAYLAGGQAVMRLRRRSS